MPGQNFNPSFDYTRSRALSPRNYIIDIRIPKLAWSVIPPHATRVLAFLVVVPFGYIQLRIENPKYVPAGIAAIEYLAACGAISRRGPILRNGRATVAETSDKPQAQLLRQPRIAPKIVSRARASSAVSDARRSLTRVTSIFERFNIPTRVRASKRHVDVNRYPIFRVIPPPFFLAQLIPK